jgi:class 3 adenylate cyclase/tetratricopeptide (TPR) repeat protein
MTDGAHSLDRRDDRSVCSRCGHELDQGVIARKSREVRKHVTVLFNDIVGSTVLTEQLDAEVISSIGSRFHQMARELLERYGASVEALGDGVKAVFGLPLLHEDDGIRAVYAAAELHQMLPSVNDELERRHGIRIDLHTGVHTGEIVTGEGAVPGGEALAHTISVAHRIMEAAGRGQIVMSHATHELARASIEAEALNPLRLKGVKDPLRAWRLLAIRADRLTGSRRAPAQLVGRAPEIGSLRAAYARTVGRRVWRVVKILGDAGVGRSSLVDGFTRELSRDPELNPPPRILWGQCWSYFNGIAADPIAQIVRQAAGIQYDDTTREAGVRLRALAGDDERLAARIAPLLGLPGSPGEPNETWRALRRLLELMASQQPLILVVDDLHAAGPSVLETVAQLAASPSHAPILLLCTIRSESLDNLPGWGAHLQEIDSFRVPLLDREQAHELIRRLLPDPKPDPEVVERIGERAQGNPLQVKELIASLADGRPETDAPRPVSVDDVARLRPAANLEAVLESRLERLPSSEQQVIEAAAVIGASFTLEQVAALCPTLQSSAVLDVLSALEQEDLLVFDVDQERFTLRPRYAHIAYRRLTKQLRIDLHVHYASLLESDAEYEEVPPDVDARTGFHLDMAYQYQQELYGDEDPLTRELRHRAGAHLAAAGHVFSKQLFSDPSTVKQLERTTQLLPEQLPVGRQARLDLANLLQEEQPERALLFYKEIMEAAGGGRDRPVELQAQLGRMEVDWFHNFQGDWNEGCADVTRLLTELTEPVSRAKAWRLLAHAYAAIGRAKDAVDAVREASRIVAQTDDRRLEAKILELACVLLFWGPGHLDDVVRQIQRLAARAEEQGLYDLQASALSILARATAMLGDIGHASELLQQARSIRPARKDLLIIGTDVISEGMVELLDNRLEAAEQILRDGYEWLRQRDASVALASVAVMLARVHLRRGNDDSAERLIYEARQVAVETHFDAQIKWRSLQAIVDARRGRHSVAKSLAREAGTLAKRSGQPDTQAEALLDLAEVLLLDNQRSEAAQAARKALRVYQERGSRVLADRVQEFLARLEAPSSERPAD